MTEPKEILQSPHTFLNKPDWMLEASFCGLQPDSLLVFKKDRCVYYIKTLLAAEEADAFSSVKDMIMVRLKSAALNVKGFYGLRLLSFNLQKGVTGFQAGDFEALLANYAKTLEIGAKRIFQYGSFIFQLHKRVPEEWGKIDFAHSVLIYRNAPEKLDLSLKKMVSAACENATYRDYEKIVLIKDLSKRPLFRFGDETQTARLSEFLHKKESTFKTEHLHLYIETAATGCLDLVKQFEGVLRGDEFASKKSG